MDMNWTAEQTELRAVVRRLLEKRPGDDDAWSTFADLGLLGLSAPEEHGGASAGLAEEVVLLEECGRALAGGPLLLVVAVARPLLSASAPDVARDVVTGRRRVALAWADTGEPWDLTALGSAGSSDAVPRTTLTTRKRLVAGLGEAGLAVVVDGGQAYLVDVPGPGVSVRARRPLDASTPAADLVLDDAPVRALAGAPVTLPALRARALLLGAAEAVGLAEAVLALAVTHVVTRTQFGRPIGSFQAVSHPLADVYADLELLRSLVLYAAARLDDESLAAADTEALVAGAAVSAARLATRSCETAIQAHGGIGMTWESSLHRYYKRARTLRTLLGPRSRHAATISSHLMLDSEVSA